MILQLQHVIKMNVGILNFYAKALKYIILLHTYIKAFQREHFYITNEKAITVVVCSLNFAQFKATEYTSEVFRGNIFFANPACLAQ